jgi:hypothetical protein
VKLAVFTQRFGKPAITDPNDVRGYIVIVGEDQSWREICKSHASLAAPYLEERSDSSAYPLMMRVWLS